MKVLVAVLLIAVFQSTQCAKILGIFPMPSRSHYILGSSLMRGLAEKGHDVTVINPFGEKTPPKNGTYRDILVTDALPDGPSFNLFAIDGMSFFVYAIFMNFLGNAVTETTMNHTNVQKLLKSDEKFDVVIVEQFVNDGLKVFAHHYQAPLVILSTCASNAWVNTLVANPAPPSYVPEQNILFSHKNFFDRVKNCIIFIFGELNRNFLFFPSQNKIMKKYFPDAPDLDVLIYNSSLVLVNSHLSTNKAVPRVPSMIDVGGYHLKPAKKLPQDLQDYLDNAPNGVIFFSMGTGLQSSNFPEEKRDAILRVFSKLKEKVLWKWETDVLPGQPPNVKLGKWLPQQDILAHPNVKAFITHGGLLSLIESVYHGKPVLAIPVFGDQIWNAVDASSNGLGRHILYREFDEATFAEALHDVLNNPKYRETMERRSKIMHDRRNPPMDDAVYWIEYVIRHQGAPHLRVEGLELSWYQYLVLDVALFLVGVISLVIYVFVMLFKFVYRKLCKKTLKNKVKKS